jgi:hypothetical protein
MILHIIFKNTIISIKLILQPHHSIAAIFILRSAGIPRDLVHFQIVHCQVNHFVCLIYPLLTISIGENIGKLFQVKTSPKPEDNLNPPECTREGEEEIGKVQQFCHYADDRECFGHLVGAVLPIGNNEPIDVPTYLAQLKIGAKEIAAILGNAGQEEHGKEAFVLLQNLLGQCEKTGKGKGFQAFGDL